MKKQIKLVVVAFAIMLVGVTSVFAKDYVRVSDFDAPLGVYSRDGKFDYDGSWYWCFHTDGEYVCLESIRVNDDGYLDNEYNTYYTLEWTSDGDMKVNYHGKVIYLKIVDLTESLTAIKKHYKINLSILYGGFVYGNQ